MRTLAALMDFDMGAGVIANGANHVAAAADDAADVRGRHKQPQLHLHHRACLHTPRTSCQHGMQQTIMTDNHEPALVSQTVSA